MNASSPSGCHCGAAKRDADAPVDYGRCLSAAMRRSAAAYTYIVSCAMHATKCDCFRAKFITVECKWSRNTPAIVEQKENIKIGHGTGSSGPVEKSLINGA
jgi:hypothetical protein